jgi:septum site-determining protein MinD
VEASEKPPPKLIINRLRPSMVKRGEMMDTADVLEVLAIELLGIVPEDETIITSTNKGQPVALEDRSAAGAAFTRIAQRLLGEDVPFQVLDDSPGLLGRFANLFRRNQ